jgi:hypothetical protein
MIGPQHLIFDTYVSAIAYNSPDRRSMLAMRHFIGHVYRRREVWPQMTTDMPPKTEQAAIGSCEHTPAKATNCARLPWESD